jgi:hypothetical protein
LRRVKARMAEAGDSQAPPAPTFLNVSNPVRGAVAMIARAADSPTMVECPREKNRPTPMGLR